MSGLAFDRDAGCSAVSPPPLQTISPSSTASAPSLKTVFSGGDFLKAFEPGPAKRRTKEEELEDALREKDAEIEKLKRLIVQLQDLILEERSIELERLKEIMSESDVGRVLDIHANSNFMLSPQQALGDNAFPHALPSSPSSPFAWSPSAPSLPAIPPAVGAAKPLRARDGPADGAEQPFVSRIFTSAATYAPLQVVDSPTLSDSIPTRGSLDEAKSSPALSPLFEEPWGSFVPSDSLSVTAPAFTPNGIKKFPTSTSPTMGGAKQKSFIKKSPSMGALVEEQLCRPLNNGSGVKGASLYEMQGQIYHLTKYQAGCRFLQKQLEESGEGSDRVSLIFNEVIEHVVEMMTDPYGQYLVPKLMQYCGPAQRQLLVSRILPHVVSFACNPYGSHGIQKILDHLTDEQIIQFTEAVKQHLMPLLKDVKGNYLLQSFLKTFDHEQVQFLYDYIRDKCMEISTHKVGCTVVSKCIDYASDEQLAVLMGVLLGRALELVQDQYGNYVIQHVLSHCPRYVADVIVALHGHIPKLCAQKFSSNVIEKCLKVADRPQFNLLIAEITAGSSLGNLLQDQYGNFVVQTALDVAASNPDQHGALVKLILPYLHDSTFKTPYLVHIRKKILG